MCAFVAYVLLQCAFAMCFCSMCPGTCAPGACGTRIVLRVPKCLIYLFFKDPFEDHICERASFSLKIN